MRQLGHLALNNRRIVISVFLLACTVIGIYSSFGHDATTVKAPAFDRDQRLIMQIVTAPTRSVIGGIEYDEAATVIHTSHELTIPASGQGMSIQSVVDGIPINVEFSIAERGEETTSIVLHNLKIHLPLRVRTSANSSLRSLGLSDNRTIIPKDFHDFRHVLGIHYVGEDLPNTFIRMRVAPANSPLPIIDITSAKPAS